CRGLGDFVRRGLLRLSADPALGARLIDPAPGHVPVRAEHVLELHALGGPVLIRPTDRLAADGISRHAHLLRRCTGCTVRTSGSRLLKYACPPACSSQVA